MNISKTGAPPALRERVFGDLRPVRPLADPWKRALVLAPVALVVFAVVHARYGTRGDLGAVLLWGLSLLQMAVGVGLAIAALRDVMPDRELSTRVRIALFACGFSMALVVTYLAWHASGTVAPAAWRYRFWRTCFKGTIEAGVPALLVILALASRGVLWRPGLVGGLAGLAAGLIADASWRTFCDVSEPTHVLSAHVAGILVLAIAGAAAGRLLSWVLAADSRRG